MLGTLTASNWKSLISSDICKVLLFGRLPAEQYRDLIEFFSLMKLSMSHAISMEAAAELETQLFNVMDRLEATLPATEMR